MCICLEQQVSRVRKKRYSEFWFVIPFYIILFYFAPVNIGWVQHASYTYLGSDNFTNKCACAHRRPPPTLFSLIKHFSLINMQKSKLLWSSPPPTPLFSGGGEHVKNWSYNEEIKSKIEVIDTLPPLPAE